MAAVVPLSSDSSSSASASAIAKSVDREVVVDADLKYIESFITSHADFPKPGILFKDIFPIFRQPRATRLLMTRLTSILQSTYGSTLDLICGMDARGFLVGPTLAVNLDAGFIPVRKAGKLPGECQKSVYTTEYSSVRRGGDKRGMRKLKIANTPFLIMFFVLPVCLFVCWLVFIRLRAKFSVMPSSPANASSWLMTFSLQSVNQHETD